MSKILVGGCLIIAGAIASTFSTELNTYVVFFWIGWLARGLWNLL